MYTWYYIPGIPVTGSMRFVLCDFVFLFFVVFFCLVSYLVGLFSVRGEYCTIPYLYGQVEVFMRRQLLWADTYSILACMLVVNVWRNVMFSVIYMLCFL